MVQVLPLLIGSVVVIHHLHTNSLRIGQCALKLANQGMIQYLTSVDCRMKRFHSSGFNVMLLFDRTADQSRNPRFSRVIFDYFVLQI